MKHQYIIKNKKLPTISSSELLVDGMDYLTTNTAQPICTIPASVYPTAFTGSKHTKKQAKQMQQRLEKIAKINIHLRALFAAVEHGHLEKARTILESTDVDVNSVNGDGLSPLDVAVLSNNRSLTKMLVSFGAREGNQFSNSETLNNHLNGLLSEAELRLQELGVNANDIPAGPRASFSSIMSSAYPSSAMTGCTGGGDTDKQASLWGRRARGLQRLVLGLSQTRPPDPPQSVTLDITGTSTVAISFKEPSNQESSLTTKFKVQWATRPDFSLICGEREIVDLQNLTCYITDLNPGVRFYFRVACGNLKGYGTYKMSTPSSCIPSSWREVDSRGTRFSGRLRMLDDLFSEVKLARPLNTCELPSLDSTVVQNRRIQKKKTTIKQLFTAASKFQKHLRRGIFLACILYHEDKVLVTNEDFLPVIEIDETYPSCINTDYHWLMKVACTWDDVKSLRTDMEKNTSSAVHFRTKLLTAAYQMQSALCIQDLGQLFHKPLKDSQGTIVISTINYVKSPKSISVLNSRWLPLNKVHKKLNVLSEEHNVGEILMGSIQDQITYHQVSNVKLSKGLYLGYLKMQSSVELIQVVVPAKTPNVLPHCKIRENPHVTAEEWHYLKNYHNHRVLHKTASDPTPFIEGTSNEQQRTFLEQIRTAIKRLFNYMDLTMEHALTHRLYDYEVVELTNDVSFIIVCPSAEMACSVPGQKELLLQRGDLLSLPIQAFEMIHLNTYQNNIIQRYSRLSCVLELDNILANHLLREAFSTSELSVAKERLSKLSELQIKLNNIWKTVRWLMDAISFARERGSSNGILLRQILDIQDTDTCDSSKLNTNSLKRTLLQIPPRDPKLVKSSTSRGSWPGPGANTSSNGCLLNAEFSKSEQHLSIAPHDNSLNLSSHYLSANSDNETSRKSSLESYKHSDNGDYDLPSHRLPPSRSEDTLFTASNKSFHNRGRSKSSTIMTSVSASTSPLLQINAKPMYSGSLLSVNTAHTTNTSDSMHSLSSDSEGNSCPIPLSSSTPRKIKKHCNKHVIPSISMLNVKANIEPRIKVDNVLTNNVESNFIPSYSNLEITSSKSLTNIRSEVDGETKLFTKPTNPSKNEKYFKVPTKVDSATSSTSDASQPGILQVFAAYETGLASGTSLKLYVTPKTTAREVVDLVVKQLNMAVVLKGKDGPIYNADKLKNFCLVAVIGARERCLRDDFKPLQLQNPWKKGRLYVRQKQDVLAALEHSSKHSAIL
ncbi:uncharacterized protein LOC123294520 isoform X2 [Chrysoperla carnea]|uniref:uncharacterized protein LOC123294520 isoform X2 n=1 Tax=Chrysoperla carnea TaxID=189513 RepID=UPI001D09235E|nr:uncharacterized protein LOC123294520 isoform X2 [Chrysoperla carnea]